MSPINIAQIEREAHKMRAKEIERILGLISARLRMFHHPLATISNILRPLFSWNPQAH